MFSQNGIKQPDLGVAIHPFFVVSSSKRKHLAIRRPLSNRLRSVVVGQSRYFTGGELYEVNLVLVSVIAAIRVSGRKGNPGGIWRNVETTEDKFFVCNLGNLVVLNVEYPQVAPVRPILPIRTLIDKNHIVVLIDDRALVIRALVCGHEEDSF